MALSTHKQITLESSGETMAFVSQSTAVELDAQKSNTTSFLTLPPEIRNRIYHHLVVKPDGIGFMTTSTKDFLRKAAQWRNLAFAKTCRTVHAECSAVFYGKNVFRFSSNKEMCTFLKGIGNLGRQSIKRVRYDYNLGNPYIAFRQLAECANLKEFEWRLRLGLSKGRWVKHSMAFVFSDCNVIELEERSYGEKLDTVAVDHCVDEYYQIVIQRLQDFKSKKSWVKKTAR